MNNFKIPHNDLLKRGKEYLYQKRFVVQCHYACFCINASVYVCTHNHVQKINKMAGGQIFRTHSSSVALSMRVKMLLHFLALYPQVIFM